jgi:hypothetical protein
MPEGDRDAVVSRINTRILRAISLLRHTRGAYTLPVGMERSRLSCVTMRRSTEAKRQILAPGSAEARALGARLRDARRQRRLSQAAVGDSFSRAYVAAVEGGDIVPSLAGLLLLCRGIGVSPGEVLGPPCGEHTPTSCPGE